MVADDIDRLARTVSTLDTCLKSNAVVNNVNIYERERSLCAEIRHQLSTTDINRLLKGNKQIVDRLLDQSFALLFELVGNPRYEDLRTYAEESIDGISRNFLPLNSTRVINNLISELNRAVHPKSVAGAFKRLTSVIHLANYTRIRRFAVHILTVLPKILAMNADPVFNALINHAPLLFKTVFTKVKFREDIGPWENIYACLCDKHLKQSGLPQKCAVLLLSELSKYFDSVARRVYVNCVMVLANPCDPSDKLKTTNYICCLQILKSQWNTVLNRFEDLDNYLNEMLRGLLLSLYSENAEVIVATIQLLSTIFSISFKISPSFDPSVSLTTSPMGSSETSSCSTSAEQMCKEPEPITIETNSTEEQLEIADPLMQPELYEQSITNNKIEDKNEIVPNRHKSLPHGICTQPVNFYRYSAALLASRFLLTGVTLKSQRDVRVSHKILAINCLTAISEQENISDVVVCIGNNTQPLIECCRFVLHEDPSLSSAAVLLIFGMAKYKIELKMNFFDHILHSDNTSVKLSLITASINNQKLLQSYQCLESVINLACKEVRSTYIPLKIACAEFLSSIDWFKLPIAIKHLQEQCLSSYFELLSDASSSVTEATTSYFNRLVLNGDFSELHHSFIGNSLLEPYVLSHTLPPVLGVPSCFNFCNIKSDIGVCQNLEYILKYWVKHFTSLCDGSIKIWFISFLEEVVSAFPVSCYYDAYNFVTPEQHCGLLSWVIDVAETSSTSTEKLASTVRLIGKLFAGENEYKLMNYSDLSENDGETERLILLLLRIINMYYSLVLKRQSTLTQSTTNILARATLSPAHSKKAVNNRLADISRFMGVNISPSKPSSFYLSEDLVRLLPSVEGAYDNFLNDPSDDVSEKFLNLLNSSMFTLGVLCETFDLAQIQPLLPELCLYLKMLIDISPIHCTSLIHQLLKIVFSKNLKNAKIRLFSSKFDNKDSDSLSKYLNRVNCNFNRYVSLMLHPEQYEEFLDRDLLWINDDSFLPNTNNPREVAESLNLFNGLVTKLRQIYIPYESVTCRKIILNILCELLRGGVKYKLIDPQNTLKETIIAQVRDSYCSNKDLAKEMALYFVFLSRFERTPNLADLEQLVIDHLRVISSDYFSAGLEFLRIIVLDFLFVRSKANRVINFALGSLFAKVDEHLLSMLKTTMDETLHLLTLRLQGTRNDEETFKSISEQYWVAFAKCWFDRNFKTTFSSAILDFTLSLHLDTQNKIAVEMRSFLDRNLETKVPCTPEIIEKLLPFIAFLLCTTDYDRSSLSGLLFDCDKPIMSKELFSQQSTKYFLLSQIYNVEKTSKDDQHEEYLDFLCHFTGKLDSDEITWIDDPSTAYILNKLASLMGSTQINDVLKSQSNGNHLQSLVHLVTDKIQNTFTVERIDDIENTQNNISVNAANFANILQTDTTKLDLKFPESTISSLQTIDICLSGIAKSAPEYEEVILSSQKQITNITDCLSKYITAETIEIYLIFLMQLQKMCQAYDINYENRISPTDAAHFLDLVTEYMVQNGEVSHYCVSALTGWFQTSAVVELFSRTAEPDLLYSFKNFITIVIQQTKLIWYTTDSTTTTNQLEFEGFESVDSPYKKMAGGVITDIYRSIQQLALHLRYHGKEQLEFISFFRSIIRNTLLNSMALIPVGLKEAIKVRLSTKNEIVFPLIQIHNLCNVDVLMDFSWRINWLGWLTKKQYEEFWMSLLGVLSSTPSGSELTDLDGLSMAEQILYSGAAVTCITDILIYTRLFPQPGNVSNGTFAVKHREQNNALYKSKIFEQMQQSEARLLKDDSPSTVFLRNLEKQKYQGHLYELNQLSALSLWTLCGEIKTTKHSDSVSEKIKPSLSLFLIEATEELDVASSVNALFLNYSHWFEKGIESVPQPLLSPTIRSMALLSDLFDNLDFYRTLYVQLKNVMDGGYFSEHIDLGYVIYGLLKAVTIIGVDTFGESSEVDKMVLSWVESGLTSSVFFVREATLQGYSYLLQSMNIEIVKNASQYINGFLLSELEAFHPVVEPKQPKPAGFHSTTYFNLVWSISFRCMQQPMQLRFAEDVLNVVRRCFANRNTAKSHMDLITSGIQNLMLHSTSFTEMNKIEDLYRDIFTGYSTKGYRFLHALRIFNIAVFTGGLLASDDNKAVYFHEDMEKLLSIYKRTETHVKPISLVLVPLLSFLYTDEVVFKKLLDFCIPQSGGLPNHLGHSLTMLTEFISRFQSTGRQSTAEIFADKCLEVAKELLKRKTREDELLAMAIIIAANKDSKIVDRLPNFIERIYKESVSEDDRSWLKKHLL